MGYAAKTEQFDKIVSTQEISLVLSSFKGNT